MLDDALYTLARSALIAGLTAQGAPSEVLQNFNPATVPALGACYLHLLFTTPVGMPRRKNVWNPTTLSYDRQMVQWLNTTMQVTTVRKRAPGAGGLTANDLAGLARGLVQDDNYLETLRGQGVSILRPGDVRNVTMKNESDQYETFPSFDFVLTHDQVIVSNTPGATVEAVVIVPV